MPATPASIKTSRRLAAAALVIVTTILLGGCVKITASTATQIDTLGPLRTEHTMCVVLDGSGGACPSASASGVAAGAGQLLLAYRVPDWAPAPTGVTLAGSGSIAGTNLNFTPSDGYAALLQSQFPRSGTKWYGFISQTSPAVPAGGSVTGKFVATWSVPDTQTASFTVFTMTGFRFAGSGYGAADRAVECSPVPFGDPSYQYDDAVCSSSWWPNDGIADSDPSNNTHEVILRNRLVLTGAPAASVTAGTSATLTYKTTGAVPFLNGNVPVNATTTVPGATVDAPTQTPIAGSHDLPITVHVPASAPAGAFSVRVTVGTGLGSKVVDVPLQVLAAEPASGGAGAAGGGATPTGTTPSSTTPTGTTTTGTTPPDRSTFAGSAAAAGLELSSAAGREALRTGKLRIKVRASRRGYVEATLKSGRTLLAKGQVAAKRKGLVTVKLKLRPAGRTVLNTNASINGTLKVRFKPRGRPATSTSVAVTLPATS